MLENGRLADSIDAELETLDEKDQKLLEELERFAALQVQYEAQRKDIGAKRRQLEQEKQKRKEEEEAAERERQRLEKERQENERREKELKESKEREKEAERRRKDAGRTISAAQSTTRTPKRPSNGQQEQEDWELMSGKDICARCKEREDDCYQLKARGDSLFTPVRSGKVVLQKRMRCRGCRDSRKKCSALSGEPETPTPSDRAEDPGQSTLKKRKTPDDAEVVTQKRAKTTGLQLGVVQMVVGEMHAGGRNMGELEVLFADLVKYQEATLSIQRDILRTIRSSMAGDVKQLDPKEEEADELLLGSDTGYELEYAEG